MSVTNALPNKISVISKQTKEQPINRLVVVFGCFSFRILNRFVVVLIVGSDRIPVLDRKVNSERSEITNYR